MTDSCQEVLSAAGVDRRVLLGVGEDAWAFASSESEAIRIFGSRRCLSWEYMVDDAGQIVAVLDFGGILFSAIRDWTSLSLLN